MPSRTVTSETKTNWSLKAFDEKGPEDKHIGNAANAAIRSGLEDARSCLPETIPENCPGAEPGQDVLEQRLRQELKRLSREEQPKNPSELVRLARRLLSDMAKEHRRNIDPVSEIRPRTELPREKSRPNNKPASLRGGQIKQSA